MKLTHLEQEALSAIGSARLSYALQRHPETLANGSVIVPCRTSGSLVSKGLVERYGSTNRLLRLTDAGRELVRSVAAD